MNANLGKLLLQLSEMDGPVVLWGRSAKPHYGPLFDRLLANGILVEQAPATDWPCCSTCECDLDARSVQEIDGSIIAACPIDASCDAFLDPEDLRSFHIHEEQLVKAITSSDLRLSPRAIIPDLWHLGALPSGQAIFLTLKHSVVSNPALLAVMRGTARGARTILLVPSGSEESLQRLEDAGDVHTVSVTGAITYNEYGRFVLDTATLEPAGGLVRLVIIQSSKTVILDGIEIPVPGQPYLLLELFTERALNGNGVVSSREIEIKCGRVPRDIVRDLRNGLARHHLEPNNIRNLIQSKKALPGYQLCLTSEQIEIRL